MDNFIESVWPIVQPILSGQIRTWLAGVGAILVHQGAIQSGDEGSFARMGSGIAIWVLVAAWSWWKNSGQTKLLALMARMHPVATPSMTTGEAITAAKEAAK